MNTDLEHDVEALWSLLFDIVTEAEKRLAVQMAVHQLTPPQFYVLKTLTEHEGRCQIGQIAREHHLTNATMTGLVKRLESMEPPLVRRERAAADGRSVDVILTDAGLERYHAVQHSLMAQARIVLGLLSQEERRQIIVKLQLYFKLFMRQFPLETST